VPQPTAGIHLADSDRFRRRVTHRYAELDVYVRTQRISLALSIPDDRGSNVLGFQFLYNSERYPARLTRIWRRERH
jgi:hypothetical protein